MYFYKFTSQKYTRTRFHLKYLFLSVIITITHFLMLFITIYNITINKNLSNNKMKNTSVLVANILILNITNFTNL